MKQKLIQAKASNMLCILSACTIVQPFSMQPSVQVDVPLSEYMVLVRSMCESGCLFFDSNFNLSYYEKAVIDYDKGNFSMSLVLFTLDMFRTGVTELKKSSSRKRDATPITLNYGDYEYVEFEDMFKLLNNVFVREESNHRIFNKAIGEINRAYNAIPVDFNLLDEHNQLYYSYLALIRYNLIVASEGGKFKPFNVKL